MVERRSEKSERSGNERALEELDARTLLNKSFDNMSQRY